MAWNISYTSYSRLMIDTSMHYQNNMHSRARCILVLISILTDLHLSLGESPKILGFTYRTKQIEILESSITSNIITLEVDQDLYHQVQCPTEFSEASRAQFVPCCNVSSNINIGCHTPEYAEDRCVDQNHATSTGIMQADEESTQRYSFKIANYQSCHSISILVKAISGKMLFIYVNSRD